jgi:uncharacterized membrane protein YbhN (UPF0104 family)
MQRAIVITVANNVIGLLTNLSIVVLAVVIHPHLMSTIINNMSASLIALTFFAILLAASIILWTSHLRQTKKLIKKFNKQWGMLAKQLGSKPTKLLLLIAVATAIVLGHALVLMFSGKALDITINLTDAIIALSVGVFVGGAVPTPGGLGAVEAGTISALILLGYEPAAATSVALLFRVATYWQPLVPGIASYLYLRKESLL